MARGSCQERISCSLGPKTRKKRLNRDSYNTSPTSDDGLFPTILFFFLCKKISSLQAFLDTRLD